MSDFSEILYEAEKLTANIEGVEELPKIDRSLRQVLEDSNDLYTRVTRTGLQDVQANLLLGSQGIDLPRIMQKLENITTKRTFEPIKPTVDTDVPSFLQNELQNIIIGVVEDEFKRCAELSTKSAWEHHKAQWIQERAKIINAMTAPSQDLLVLNKQNVFLDPQPITSNKLALQETVYASKIIEYNRSVTSGSQRLDLTKTLAKAAEEFKDTKVNDMWEILKYMTDLPPFPPDGNISNLRNSAPVIHVLIKQAKRYLEDRYKTYMSSVITENLSEARRGGMPGTYSLARSFVGIRMGGMFPANLQDDRLFWPVVYYCLRSGDLFAALSCLKSSRANVKDVIDLLELKLKNAPQSEINKKEATLKTNYQRTTRNSTDPFLRLVYDVLCCFDTTEEHSEVTQTADDYLWLKLSFLRIEPDSEDIQPYKNLQSTILEDYGESHYDALNQPYLYFQMLTLTGQFEAAFEFLARIQRYQIHGVHMALALNELNILCLPLHASSPLMAIDPVDPKPTRLLNISRLLMIYVQKFELYAIKEAIYYYYLLRNIKDETEQSLFLKCVVDLTVETREYELIFGKIQTNGIRTQGFLDELFFSDTSIESIAQLVGENLIAKGLFEDAVELLDIANNQEEVLSLLSTLLSQVVQLQSTEGSLRERLPNRINQFANRYSSLGYTCSAKCLSTFTILNRLLIFFDYYHTKEFGLALKVLDEIKIVPLQLNDVEERVGAFKGLSNEVCRVIPDVVLATMNILFAQYQKVKSNEYISNKYQDTSQDNHLAYLRDQAKALTSFTAMLPYRMPGDTNSRLVQMEILMH